MGGSSGTRLITAEEGAVMVDELEATAPMIEQQYPDADAVAIRSALTDADLFLSYNMPAKAVVPLLAVLSRAPYDVRLNQAPCGFAHPRGTLRRSGVLLPGTRKRLFRFRLSR